MSLPVAFARVLRGLGLDVPVSRVVLFAQALDAVGLDRRDRVYWAGRATLTAHPEDAAAYDAAFAAFFGAPPADDDAPPARSTPPPLDAAAAPYSPHDLLRHKDFAAYTEADFAEAQRLMSALRLSPPTRRSRRHAPTRRRTTTGTPDLRRTLRRSLKTHGEPVARSFKAPTPATRRLVLLLDVSGSMEPYARAFARFLHAAVAARNGRVDAFTLGTRVTRVTKQLRWKDPDAALRAAAAQVEDWAGGTRLGDGLKHFSDHWGARGAVVVILSDGWDRGDPDDLARQLDRLRRQSHRLVWANPHKASPGYEPLARGMAAALPYVDAFVEGHNLVALEALAQALR